MPISTQRKSRVLVVDDDETLNQLVCSFLNSKDLQTVAACSLSDARNILKIDAAVDLIVLDYHLGDGVGTELLVPEALDTYRSVAPVIMISANEEPEFLEQCFIDGVDDYIIKPVNLSLLALKVEALIRSVNMQRLIKLQNDELERYKADAEREQQIAKFTYEYLLRQNSYAYEGVDVWCKSFSAFSGDLILVKKSPSGNLYLIFADATGHGLAAAITIMPAVTIFNSMVAKGFHIQKIVSEINRKLATDTPADRFVAAILIEINPYRRELSVWNGGMPSAFWVNDGVIIHRFKSTHMALGILDEYRFDASVTTIDLPTEGFIFAYSDGLTEQENKYNQPFSTDRLIRTIQSRPEYLLTTLAQDLFSHAEKIDYSDDVSMCTITPSSVFQELKSPLTDTRALHAIGLTPEKDDAFEWSLTLSGRQLENCEIPPLCNHFLQQIGVDQHVCQKLFAVLTEFVSEAIDHGILNLSSKIKDEPDGFIQYFYKREEKLKVLSNSDFVKMSISWLPEKSGGIFMLEVECSSTDYTFASWFNDGALINVRGRQLIKKLTESVEIIPPGNKIRATIK